MIHASGSAENSFRQNQDLLSTDFLAVLLSQFSRFCVPVFVFLSGYGLASKYKEPLSTARMGDFARRRLSRIVLPYVVWTIALLALMGRFRFDDARSVLSNLETLLPYLYRQGADYHFYFFSIIIQCYLVFPVLLFFLENPRRSRLLLLFLLVLTILYASPAHILFSALGLSRPGFFSAFLLYWVLYFYLGMLLARDKSFLLRLFPRALAFLSVVLFALMIIEYLYWSVRAPDPGHYNHFTRITVIFYSLTFIAFYARYAPAWISTWPARLRDFLILFASLSFTIYIIHTWVLRIVEQNLFLLSFGLTVAASLAIAYALERLIPKQWQSLRLILGLPVA